MLWKISLLTITRPLATNQKIKITDLGNSVWNITIEKPNSIQIIVIALREVTITWLLIYCNTALYNPKLINNGIAIAGIRRKAHQFGCKYSIGHRLSRRKANEIQMENSSIIISTIIMISPLYNLGKYFNFLNINYYYGYGYYYTCLQSY